MQRNNQLFSGYRINPVEDFTVFAGFTCLAPNDADRDLDNFIHHDAQQHYADRIAVTYALTRDDHPVTPFGFATLQNDAIVIDRESPLPEVAEYHYPAFPAVKIGRLGISLDMQGAGLGTVLLQLIKRLMCTANRTGCRFITVDARRDKTNKIDTIPFYEKNGFTLLPCRKKTSRYIPMYFDLEMMGGQF
ncbi:GNAT family N-acetyltransferase [Desulfovibrio sp. OttesenSCG-928-F20]|nr:GNAT family N-acetyltransferase [Desulfovibrio sp. OttesenSCG-928-M16]MDL2290770.1 GNAT family N-acetyltransferase [Desulfovibrio sp. OttesenSCG-928-F20]